MADHYASLLRHAGVLMQASYSEGVADSRSGIVNSTRKPSLRLSNRNEHAQRCTIA